MPPRTNKKKQKGRKKRGVGKTGAEERSKETAVQQHEHSASSTSCSPPDEGTPCWICLEEGPSDNGHQTRRDCACRGPSAGYAHLACLVQYATRKSEEDWKRQGPTDAFLEPWISCPNCKQEYQRSLGIDMAREFVKSTDGLSGIDYYRSLKAQSQLAKKVAVNQDAPTSERYPLALRLFTDVLESIQENSEVFMGLNLLYIAALNLRAETLKDLGTCVLSICHTLRRADDDPAIGFEYFDKSRALYQKLGRTSKVHEIDAENQMFKEMLGVAEMDPKVEVKLCRDAYDAKVRSGEDQACLMGVSLQLFDALLKNNQVFEAYDFLCDLTRKCHRIYGPDHETTKYLRENTWGLLKDYLVIYRGRQATLICHYASSENYLVREDDSKEHIAFVSELLFWVGTPVVCVGLISAQHLNGKRGVVLGYDDKLQRYSIKFEDENISPCLVKPENLKVIFFEAPVSS